MYFPRTPLSDWEQWSANHRLRFILRWTAEKTAKHWRPIGGAGTDVWSTDTWPTGTSYRSQVTLSSFQLIKISSPLSSNKIKSKSTQIEYDIKHHVSCESSNLIYLITCKTCGMQYVGQTKRTPGERSREHFRDIQKKSPKLLSVHLNSRGHNGITDISISILSFIRQTPNSLSAQKARDRMEMFWYNQLGTMVPRGLNVEKTAKKSYQ